MVHIFWAVQKPLSMDQTVYTYQLPKLEAVNIAVQVKYVVDVMYASAPNGTPAVQGIPTVTTTRYQVNLVTPRSTR